MENGKGPSTTAGQKRARLQSVLRERGSSYIAGSSKKPETKTPTGEFINPFASEDSSSSSSSSKTTPSSSLPSSSSSSSSSSTALSSSTVSNGATSKSLGLAPASFSQAELDGHVHVAIPALSFEKQRRPSMAVHSVCSTPRGSIKKPSRKKRINKTLDSLWVTSIILLCTLFALYFLDIAILAEFPSSWSYFLWLATIVVFLVFFIEICVAFTVRRSYRFSFFFWLDLVGTLSLLPDIFGIGAAFGLPVARAGRIARSSTRISRVFRIFRVWRVLRLTRLIRMYAYYFRKKKMADVQARAPSRVGTKLNEIMSNRVVILIVSMLIVTPFLELEVSDAFPTMGLEFIEQAGQVTGVDSGLTQELVDSYIGNNTNPVLKLNILGTNFIDTNIDDLLTSWLTNTSSASGFSYAVVDFRPVLQETALLNVILVSFVIILFGAGAYFLNKDVKKLVVDPIERMTDVVRKLAGSLFTQTNDQNSEEFSNFEPLYVEQLVEKMADFFNVGDKNSDSGMSSEYSEDSEDEEQENIDGIEMAEVVNPVEQQLSSIEAVLADEQGQQFFKIFLTREWSVENLLFYKEVDKYRREMMTRSNNLAENFIFSGSPLEVNIPYGSRVGIENSLEKPDVETFDDAQEKIFQLMARDSFPRFLKSDLFRSLVEKKNEMKERAERRTRGSSLSRR